MKPTPGSAVVQALRDMGLDMDRLAVQRVQIDIGTDEPATMSVFVLVWTEEQRAALANLITALKEEKRNVTVTVREIETQDKSEEDQK